MERMTNNKTHNKFIALIIFAFIVLSVSASVINPIHEATDELRHYRFVQHIVQTGRLPVQDGIECRTQSHHPPLFYSLGALATFWIDTGQWVCAEPETNPFWNYRQWEVGVDNKNLYLHRPNEAFPWSGEALAAHLTRFVNVLIGAATVYLTWLIGRAIWPKRPYLALGGTAFVAFNPMFVYMAGAINNDVIAALSGTAVALACVRLVQDENGLSRRWGVVLGVLYGLALLSKFNLLALGGTIGVAATWVAWRRKQWRQWLEVAVIAGLTTALLSGWWFVRNVILYGEPTGVQQLTEMWGMRNPSESWGLAFSELKPTWTSLWGRFGYGQIPLPDGIYIGLLWVIGLGLLGLLIPLVLRRKNELNQVGMPLLVLVLNVVLGFVVVFYYLLISPAGAMGRFFYPALSSLSVLAFYGLSCWFTLIPQNTLPDTHQLSLATVTNAGMAVLTIVALWGYLAPAYGELPTFDDVTAVPNPATAQFDNFLLLKGYEVEETTITAGGLLDIDLYWEVIDTPPGDFLVFVHIIDNESGALVAQRDTHPGVGRFPSSNWQKGDHFVDSIRLWLPETVYTPSSASISIGFHVPNGYRLAVSDGEGNNIGDAFAIKTISLMPRSDLAFSDQFENPQSNNFAGIAQFVGYQYEHRVISPGESLRIDTHWQSLQDAPGDYKIQFILRDQAGEQVRSKKGRPQQGELPTTEWVAGQVVSDWQWVPIPENLPSGTYTIELRLFNNDTKQAEPLLDEDGHILNNHLSLANIMIRPSP